MGKFLLQFLELFLYTQPEAERGIPTLRGSMELTSIFPRVATALDGPDRPDSLLQEGRVSHLIQRLLPADFFYEWGGRGKFFIRYPFVATLPLLHWVEWGEGKNILSTCSLLIALTR